MKHAAFALILSATPALAHVNSDVHFHGGDVLAAMVGLALYAGFTTLRKRLK